jgi:hypothetical protein
LSVQGIWQGSDYEKKLRQINENAASFGPLL